jgi:hypothetical protein
MKDIRAMLGPCTVPLYPITSWSKRRLTDDQMKDAWRLCGPTVELVMGRMPLWQAFVSVYLEGLMHGHELTITEPKP